MMMYDICCIGHITADKVINADTVMHMPGGTAFYFSCAVSLLDINYLLVTALAPAEMEYVTQLHNKGIEVKVQPSTHTVCFENIYERDQDKRTQKVLQKADQFNPDQLLNINARIFHLGPLLADDITTGLIKMLAGKGIVSLDVQGYLRKVENTIVYAADWRNKQEALQYVTILKADEAELQALTECKTVNDGIKTLTRWGVKEIVVTNGSKGSLIYNDDTFYQIPAYRPEIVADATGCGDTYMAGYLYQRIKGAGIQQAGEFAAAMAGLKTATAGAFAGTAQDVIEFLERKNIG